MYTSRTGLILGFHGTDQSVVDAVLKGEQDLIPKNNPYDWLGYGVYFWDNSPSRALSWAQELSKRPNSDIKNPAVIGAIIDLGYCLDLLDYKNLALVKRGYELLKNRLEIANTPMPQNKGNNTDLLRRELDCAVIETLHEILEQAGQVPFASARGVFWEGKELYPNAGFLEKDHIQLCVRDINCIKGYFLPLQRVEN
jgi:hypothetical protein